ncbi:MAG TPA: ATP-binding cassette domain-containing protein [Vicinamibacteria bacterium]
MSDAPAPLIAVDRLSHYFGSGSLRRQVLQDVTTEVGPGEIVILTGPSGSGKTTLLTLMGALRSAQEGSLRVLGHELRGAGKAQLVAVRRSIGYIFQTHNLLDSLTALDNVAMGIPRRRGGISAAEGRRRCLEMLRAVGLEESRDHRPRQMSGGQRQRVAVARALVGQPKIVLADEPTASLDKKSGREVADLLHRLAREQGCAVLLVTHDNRILDFADRVIYMEDGRLVSSTTAVIENTRQFLRTIAQNNRSGELTRQVESLSVAEFGELLDRVTSEFQEFLRMVSLGDDEAFESMLDQVIEAFTVKAGQILQADKTSLLLVDEERGELWSKVAQGSGGGAVEIRIPLRSGVAGHVVATGKAMNVASAYDEPLFNREVDQRTGYRTRNILCMPVVDDEGRVLGALSALNKAGGGRFDEGDEQRFREFASSMTVILETWRRLQRTHRKTGRSVAAAKAAS